MPSGALSTLRGRWIEGRLRSIEPPAAQLEVLDDLCRGLLPRLRAQAQAGDFAERHPNVECKFLVASNFA
jgi:hypothetical protein